MCLSMQLGFFVLWQFLALHENAWVSINLFLGALVHLLDTLGRFFIEFGNDFYNFLVRVDLSLRHHAGG